VAVYRRGSGHSVLLVGIYVDNLIITGAEEKELEAFKAQIKEVFDMSDLGLLCIYRCSPRCLFWCPAALTGSAVLVEWR
jgi:hypothetical protein